MALEKIGYRLGASYIKQPRWVRIGIKGAVVLIPLLLIGKYQALHEQRPELVTQSTLAAVAISEQQSTYKGEQWVRASLKDPVSAQFRGVRFNPNMKTFCGEVNAKNGFGGYNGYARFVSGGPSSTVIETERERIDDIWRIYC